MNGCMPYPRSPRGNNERYAKKKKRLTTNASSGPAVKGQKVPPGPVAVPPLGVKLFGPRAEDRLIPVHAVKVIHDHGALGYEERRLAIGAAAVGEDGVADGFPGVGGDDGVESERC